MTKWLASSSYTLIKFVFVWIRDSVPREGRQKRQRDRLRRRDRTDGGDQVPVGLMDEAPADQAQARRWHAEAPARRGPRWPNYQQCVTDTWLLTFGNQPPNKHCQWVITHQNHADRRAALDAAQRLCAGTRSSTSTVATTAIRGRSYAARVTAVVASAAA
jgi:hypothetical protein